MITHCRTCKQDTIVKDQPNARCSFCDQIVIRECAACGSSIYPKKRGRLPAYCAACRANPTRRHQWVATTRG